MPRRDDEWFQNSRWDEQEKQKFFSRLSRSRGPFTRLQHLHTKASYLSNSGDAGKIDAAIELHRRIDAEAAPAARLDPQKASTYAQWAKNAVAAQARLHRIRSRPSEALRLYRECLGRETGAPDPYVLDYAQLVIELGLRSEYQPVLELLHSSWRRHESTLGVFRATLFRYAYLQAVLCRELGDLAAAKPFARAALAVAAAASHGIGERMNLSDAMASTQQLQQMQSIASDV